MSTHAHASIARQSLEAELPLDSSERQDPADAEFSILCQYAFSAPVSGRLCTQAAQIDGDIEAPQDALAERLGGKPRSSGHR